MAIFENSIEAERAIQYCDDKLTGELQINPMASLYRCSKTGFYVWNNFYQLRLKWLYGERLSMTMLIMEAEKFIKNNKK